mmetsp:Transcript_19508/g.40404  ORF Transcript_19508/g.40404 Transcript_19508/m.40404 type:complete len:137 (+) Transcript_19508:160-570(+)|eukprot:CAMPEP_0172440162 /NCGR_PEP_ID=MMETSP1065-20121228/895_1 /TAXON_ID=265537 /ORGANISM="Amphiprora paludosa, Strain CCMP125" /LENGTH=136 /DNA_ID=CAMNT_0013188945 /DNA_START=88 /DNA_END=498 /DNA_ORIENTATION=+
MQNLGSDEENRNFVSDESQHDTQDLGHFALHHGAVKSVDGWNIFVRGLSANTGEGDLLDAFSEFGPVQHVKLNRDRRTGAASYAIVEFNSHREAQDAINRLHGNILLGRRIEVHWAFVKPTASAAEFFTGGAAFCG